MLRRALQCRSLALERGAGAHTARVTTAAAAILRTLQNQQHRDFHSAAFASSAACRAPRRNSGNSSGIGVGGLGEGAATSATFDPKDLDVESLQHPYWDTDLDFFVPYADDEGDEGGLLSGLGGDEGEGGLWGEAASLSEEQRELLKKEWK